MECNPDQPCPQGAASLIAFTPGDVPRRYPDVVQRLAVMVPCFGPQAVQQREQVPDMTLRLVSRWRRRVMELAESGHPALAGEAAKAWNARKYALNCLPAFAIVPQQSRCCRLREVCPFCWAREVRKTWLKIDRAFFAPSGGRGPSAYDLVEDGRDLSLPPRTNCDRLGRVLPDGQTLDALPELFAKWAANRRGEVAKFEGLIGSFQTIHIGFKDGLWLVGRRCILMINRTAVTRPLTVPKNCRYFLHHEHPSRRVVMEAVARACRYPTFLLKGDAGLVVSYLAGRKGRQLSAMTGKFRNGKAP